MNPKHFHLMQSLAKVKIHLYLVEAMGQSHVVAACGLPEMSTMKQALDM
jgi:hypothetical protein